jgi:hypothetical protein
MGMDRILERIRKGSGPPLRKTEFARAVGYSIPTVEKLIEARTIKTVGLTKEQRIPVSEALRIARDLQLFPENT